MIKFIPNILSFFRLAAPVFLTPMILENDFKSAFVIFSMAASSDFLDGYWARKFHVSSDLGRILDPLADKVLMVTSYALLAYVKFIPTYVATLVVGRDFLILNVVAICKFRRIPLKIQPLLSSKINTAIQLLFLVGVLACKSLEMNVPWLIELSRLIVSVSTIFSGAEYVQKYYWIKDKIFGR
ncbi:MAG: CDP-alcohol phosphatidyltransferase family protein [Holosporaceae bacterium]|jgi:cardiolipin synthase|nr:CDP-alcohol phosphatidyltransferase family protein [Holosporaceae bacterium]